MFSENSTASDTSFDGPHSLAQQGRRSPFVLEQTVEDHEEHADSEDDRAQPTFDEDDAQSFMTDKSRIWYPPNIDSTPAQRLCISSSESGLASDNVHRELTSDVNTYSLDRIVLYTNDNLSHPEDVPTYMSACPPPIRVGLYTRSTGAGIDKENVTSQPTDLE